MPLDLALSAELERAASPPVPPPIAIEQPWRSDAAAHAQRESDRRLAISARAVSDWRASVDALRTRLNELQSADWSPELAAVIRAQATHAEEQAERRAMRAARAEKDIERVQKTLKKRDPSLAAVHRETARRALHEQQELVSDILDFALFLRSLHGPMSETDRGGPTFTSPEDLEAYLRTVLSA